ncbi:unnamed protein product [Ectocarpus fasciculatus]
MLTLEASPDMSFGDTGDRWERAAVKGCLAAPSGVSGVLGLVGGQYVLWSKACGGLATCRWSSGAVARCGGCREFFRDGVLKRLAQAAKPVLHPCTNNKDMTSAQKDRKLQALKEELKAEREAHIRLREWVNATRYKEVASHQDQRPAGGGASRVAEGAGGDCA